MSHLETQGAIFFGSIMAMLIYKAVIDRIRAYKTRSNDEASK